MELSFKNRTIRTICENEEAAEKEYGLEVAKKLQSRLADIIAAKNTEEIVVGNPREIFEDDYCSIRIDLCDGYFLVFCSNHIQRPCMENGNINWSKVSRVKILRIGI